MAETAELESRIARLEAALTATADALEAKMAVPDHGPDLKAAQDELMSARQRIETLEQQDRDREKTLDAALDRAKTAEGKLAAAPAMAPVANPASGDTAALQAQIADLKEARAQDLAEMKSLLAELEPMLETADA